MRLQYCGVHDDCQIVDNVHTPKHSTTAETFPDWPVTEAEYKRGTPDSELMPRLETLEAEVRGAVELVDAFGPTVETTQGALKSLLDRANVLVGELGRVEQGAGLSAKSKRQLEAIAAQVERQAQDWATFVSSHEAFLEQVKEQTAATAAHHAERMRRELVELRAEQSAQAAEFAKLREEVATYAKGLPDEKLITELRELPAAAVTTAAAVLSLGDRLTKQEQNWTAFLDRFDRTVERLERRNATIEGIASRTLDAANAVRGELNGQIEGFRKLREDVVGPERLGEKEKLEADLAEMERLFKEALRVRSAPGVA